MPRKKRLNFWVLRGYWSLELIFLDINLATKDLPESNKISYLVELAFSLRYITGGQYVRPNIAEFANMSEIFGQKTFGNIRPPVSGGTVVYWRCSFFASALFLTHIYLSQGQSVDTRNALCLLPIKLPVIPIIPHSRRVDTHIALYL